MIHDRTTQPAFEATKGRPDALGAIFDGEGTNFALFSGNATRVELCLYSQDGGTETAKLDLPEMQGGIWFGYLPGAGPGQVYGYREMARGSRRRGTASTRPSCCWTLMPASCGARWSGTRLSLAIRAMT